MQTPPPTSVPAQRKMWTVRENKEINQSDVMIDWLQFPGIFCSALPVAEWPGHVMGGGREPSNAVNYF